MRIRKKLLSLIICAALLICALPMDVSAASDFPTVLAEAKKGVVQIYGLGDGGLILSSWIGTGFAVGNQGEDSNIFLTNWHVVTGEGDFTQDKTRIWILQENCEIDEQTLEPDPNKSITCEVLKTTTGYPDYAIIRATEPVKGYKPLPLLSSEAIPDGTKVYALGYPGVVGDFSVSHYGIDDITATDGIVSQHMQFAPEGNTWVLMHTAQISGGNSGGPLITEEGAVVGLNTYGFGENDTNMNRYCAVYIDYAIEGLDELGLPYELFAAPGSEEAPTETETQDVTEDTDEPTGGEDDSEKKKDSGEERNLVPVIIAGGAVLAGAVVVLVIVLKKKKEREEEELRRQEAERRLEAERRQQEEERRRQEELRREAQRQQEQEVKAQLQLNGGTIYPVRASGCVIGRERDCNIILPENTSGVSRHHCKLEFRDGQLILTDLNSSYGTYIHSKRVPPNTPVALKPGSSFCLGSDKCKFTVC